MPTYVYGLLGFKVTGIAAETEKALLCSLHVGDNIGDLQVWVPKSQIRGGGVWSKEAFEAGSGDLLVVSDWWAGKAGLNFGAKIPAYLLGPTKSWFIGD